MKEQMVEELGKKIKEKNTMSKEYEGKINKRIFSNIFIAILILIYLTLVILGNEKIENDVFIVYLKVASIVLSLLSIFVFERSYRTADGRLCVYGIETLTLAILTLAGGYLTQIMKDSFAPIVAGVAIVVPIYYLIKSIGIYVKSKKDYAKTQSDIKEIVREDLPETVETKKRRTELEAQMEEYNRLNNNSKPEVEEIFEEDEEDNEDDEIEMVDEIEEEEEEDPYPRIVNQSSRVIKTSSRQVEESVGFDDEEDFIIFDDDYRERKVVEEAIRKTTTTKKPATTKKEVKDEEVKPKTTRKPTTKAKEVEKEEKPATKKTTTKKSTTSTKKTVKDEEVKPKTTRKSTTKAKEVEKEEKPVTKKTTTKKSTTTTKKTTSTKKKTTTDK